MRLSFILAVALMTTACAGSSEQARSEHERDSIIGQSQLPGAQGVQGALDASDSADARAARLDSLAAEP